MVKIKRRRRLRIGKRRYPVNDPRAVRTNDISINALKELVTSKEEDYIIQKIEHETIPIVRDAWIEYFLERTGHTKLKTD